eukprot:gene7181-12850_t
MDSTHEIRRNFITPFILVGITNIIVNSFLIHAMRRLRRLGRLSYRLILCYTITGIVNGMQMLAEEITWAFSVVHPNMKAELFLKAVAFASVEFSVMSMLAIAVDRQVHMKHPHRYNQIITNSRMIKYILAALTASIVCATVLTLGQVFSFSFISHLILTLNGFLMFVYISLTYFKAYRELIRRTAGLNISTSNTASWQNTNKDFAKAIMCILASMAVSFLPYFTLTLLLAYSENNSNKRVSDQLFIIWLVTKIPMRLQQSINSILMIVFDKRIRKYASNMCCKQ